MNPVQPAAALPAVEYAERSDPGRDPEKQVNEDACGRRETRFGHLCVVCDGMGGHAAGREAAELALNAIFETFDNAPAGTPPAAVLRSAVEEASRRIHTMRTSEIALGRPGSTVVSVLMHADGTEVAHVGDSRAYLVHEGQISRLTRDHSVVQEMVDRGLLTLQQAAHHPDANRITRALGMADEIEVEVRPVAVPHLAGDAFVLCSDGLSDLVEDLEILEIVGNEPAAQAVGKLVDLANARGGHDNVTVIVLRARETAIAATGAVAPTVAQTSVAQGPVPSSGDGASPAPTERGRKLTMPLDVPTEHAEVPPHAAAPFIPGVGPALRPDERTEPPRSVRTVARRGPNVAVTAGVLLAVGAVALLGAVLLSHFAERRGHRNGTTTLGLPESDAAAKAPTPIGPESVVLPAASAPAEPIAPLEPASTSSGHPRHQHR